MPRIAHSLLTVCRFVQLSNNPNDKLKIKFQADSARNRLEIFCIKGSVCMFEYSLEIRPIEVRFHKPLAVSLIRDELNPSISIKQKSRYPKGICFLGERQTVIYKHRAVIRRQFHLA